MSANVSDIKKTAAKLISSLNDRNREIVSRRFGLKDGRKETLESVGKSHKITRERVRQIQDASLKTIKASPDFQVLTQPYVRLAKNIIDQVGGVMNEKSLFSTFSGSEKPNSVNASLVFVLDLDGSLKRVQEDDNFYSFWSVSNDRVQNFKKSVRDFINVLGQSKGVVAQEAIADFISRNENISGLSVDDVNSFISISKKIGKNVFGQIGLTSWPEIKPRGVRDKSFLVLKREAEPRHFRDITKLINSVGFSPRKAHVQTVHNELIKDKRFVLVGRGVYALSEWGYKPGTVKDVIADLLREKGPMKKEDIVAHVLKVRMVKPNTVLLGVQDKELFEENEEGHIAFRGQNSAQEV